MILHVIIIYVKKHSANKINGKKKCENEKPILMQFVIPK